MNMSFKMDLEQEERPPESLEVEILRANVAEIKAENSRLEKLVADLQKENELLTQEAETLREQYDKAMMDFDEAANEFDHLMIDSALKNSQLQQNMLEFKVETMMLKSKINELTNAPLTNELEVEEEQLVQDNIPESSEIQETPDLDLKQLLLKYWKMIGFAALFLLGCKYGFAGSSSLDGKVEKSLLQQIWNNGAEAEFVWNHPPRI